MVKELKTRFLALRTRARTGMVDFCWQNGYGISIGYFAN